MQFIIGQKNLYILIFSILGCLQVKAQTIEQCLAFADKQLESQNYHTAVKEYQRVLFFNSERYGDYVYQRLADCYFNSSQLSKAAKYYNLAYFVTDNDSLKNEILFKETTCYLLEKNFNYALIELLSLTDSLPEYFYNKQQFYLGVSYFGLEDFKLAQECFLNSIDSSHISAKQEIEAIFTGRKNLYRPNPKAALYMSLFLPGLGQFYAGDIKNGINSLALTGALFWLGMRTARQYAAIDAFMAVFPWFLRYYQGGYNHAQQIAENKRAMRREAAYRKILDIKAGIN